MLFSKAIVLVQTMLPLDFAHGGIGSLKDLQAMAQWALGLERTVREILSILRKETSETVQGLRVWFFLYWVGSRFKGLVLLFWVVQGLSVGFYCF